MNTTGCPPGLATDEALFYENTPLSCDMNIVAYGFLAVGATSIKLIVAIGQTVLWLRREAQMKKSPNESRKKQADLICGKRLPFVPLMSWLGFKILVIWFTLVGLDIANRNNGLVACFVGLYVSLFFLSALAYLQKFVALGHRIASPAKWMKDLDTNNSLSRFDNLEKVSIVLCYIAGICSLVTYSIISLILPGEYVVFQVAIGFQAWFVNQHAISLFYHLQRVKNAVSESRSIIANASPEGKKELDRVYRKLKEQQVVVFISAFVSDILYALLIFKVIIAHYYIFTILVWIEALIPFFILISNILYIIRKSRASASAGDSTTSSQQQKGANENRKSVTANQELGHHHTAPLPTLSSSYVPEGAGGGGRASMVKLADGDHNNEPQ